MPNAKVLIVDDDQWIGQAAARVLTRAGFDVERCESAEAGLEIVAERRFDAAICDYNLPGINGVAFLTRLRELQSGCVRILMTGLLDVPTVVTALNTAAITRVLQKPVLPNDLVTAVAQALSARNEVMDSHHAAAREAARRDADYVRSVIAGDWLQLALQPLVRADDGHISGFEALLRSTHPVYDGPASILHAVEKHDLVQELADRVALCAERWLHQLQGEPALFINMHPREFADPERLSRRLDRLSPWAERIVLEITERSTLDDVRGWEQTVASIVGRGFRIAVDDIGSGYSSLSVMASLQPSYIKIDMSIVRDVHLRAPAQRVVDLLCKFAEATRTTVVGEGVETEAEAQALRAAGVELLQGYHFGRPSLDPPAGFVRAA
jgi:EAL domain-containing protein (putative c-di-GMP-specific phosphodiesterase class I)/CheY-like chemotaxis protein